MKVQEKEACPICTDDFEEGIEVAVLACDEKHFFHDYCINGWITHNKKKRTQVSCPMCRIEIAEPLIRIIDYKYPVIEQPEAEIEESNEDSDKNLVEMKLNKVKSSSAVSPSDINMRVFHPPERPQP